MLKLKHNRYYRDSYGNIHFVQAADPQRLTPKNLREGKWTFCTKDDTLQWNTDGTPSNLGGPQLIEEVVVGPVVTLSRYLNIYNKDNPTSTGLCIDREDADRKADPDRIACVRVEWQDNQFDD
jgi:hypothetical protein